MTELLQSREKRLEVLKGIIKDLHAGGKPEVLKEKFAKLLQEVNPSEIAELEQQLINEGMPVEEVTRLCDVHVAVFQDALEQQSDPAGVPGHPVHTFLLENDALRSALVDLKEQLIQSEGGDPEQMDWGRLISTLKTLGEVEKHYQRKEYQLFPFLEKHGVSGPTQVMWATHDEIRALFKKAINAGEVHDLKTLIAEGNILINAMEDMFYKEEKILFPMALDTLSEQEWAEIREGGGDFGYTLAAPGEGWQPEGSIVGEAEIEAGGENQIKLDVGVLTGEQLNLLLIHLPVDISYVDEDNRVRYYSQGKERFFPRSPGIIGRMVQNCHPPGSVDVVNKIVAAFKEGSRDTADFWIQMGEKFLSIRFIAIRDEQDRYRGVVEVVQDITELRQLEGERRLLHWE